jgi:hypothetical protein
MRMNARTASIGTAIAVAGMLLAGASATSATTAGADRSHGAGPRWSSSLDTASSAMPTTEDPQVADHAITSVHTRKADAKAVASAVATSDCDGCAATSTVFQVVYVDARRAVASADNSAAAWSSCVDCSSSAVSVQLVVARDPVEVKVNNRAMALNVGCDGCATSAAAIQFVLAGGTKRDLTTASRQLISEIEEQLADRLAGATAPSARSLDAAAAERLADETAERLEAIILSDLGGATLERSVDVQVGG